MICYRDRTYCTAPCATEDCDRKLTDVVLKDAREWWGKDGAPIARADLSGHCGDFVEVRKWFR